MLTVTRHGRVKRIPPRAGGTAAPACCEDEKVRGNVTLEHMQPQLQNLGIGVVSFHKILYVVYIDYTLTLDVLVCRCSLQEF